MMTISNTSFRDWSNYQPGTFDTEYMVALDKCCLLSLFLNMNYVLYDEDLWLLIGPKNFILQGSYCIQIIYLSPEHLHSVILSIFKYTQ